MQVSYTLQEEQLNARGAVVVHASNVEHMLVGTLMYV